MRKLYLVPIIHTRADMGSVAPALDERAAAELGHELWQKHQQIVFGFWDSISRFLDSLDVSGFRVYQDGLVANGAEGLRIIREGARQGSRNYQIVEKLLGSGAVLMKTEDIGLVTEEHRYIRQLARAASAPQRETAALRYQLAQDRLIRGRDDYIGERINRTLGEEATGILFIGALHDVIGRLASDIRVTQVKEIDKVRQYHRALITRRRYDRYLQQLGEYLVSPVPAGLP